MWIPSKTSSRTLTPVRIRDGRWNMDNPVFNQLMSMYPYNQVSKNPYPYNPYRFSEKNCHKSEENLSFEEKSNISIGNRGLLHKHLSAKFYTYTYKFYTLRALFPHGLKKARMRPLLVRTRAFFARMRAILFLASTQNP